MKINYQTQRVTEPTVFVTKGRQRVKQYDNSVVFLKNGDEFELELFNPTNNKILAKISINGILISESGIVLRPGERVFLERYLDEAKKFLFETYEIDANDPNAVEAIKLNGIIEVEFYEEYKPIAWTYTYYPSNWNNAWPSSYNPTFTYSVSGNFSDKNSISCYSSDTYSISLSSTDQKSKETGRVEKGSNSNQSFTAVSNTFNSWYTWKSTWKILPESQKLVVKEDLKVFCTSCGTKRRKTSHKFCPNCGTRFA